MTPVFGALTQEALDRAYDQTHWAANGAEVQARILARSAEIARSKPPRSLRYGPAEPQVVDIFAAEGASNAPVIVLIHGGAWRLSMREGFYGAAPAITAAGCILAVVGFQCLPDVSVTRMAEQVCDAVARIAKDIGAFGGNPRRLHIVGHSSGGHLAAVALTDSRAGPLLGGGTLISGLYEMAPVMLSSRRLYVKLTSDEAAALSPIRHLDRLSTKVSVWWGTEDSPEFQRQSRDLADALAQAGRSGGGGVLAGRNHFEMLEELENAESPVFRTMLSHASR